MEIKRQTMNVKYKIERKPDGGFVARSDDPAVPSIEAPTQEELSRKIQAEVFGKTLSGLNLPFKLGKTLLDIQVDRKPGRVLTFNAATGDARVSEPATKEEMEEFAKTFGGIVEKNFPELGKALAARAAKQGPATGADSQTGVVLDGNLAGFNATGNTLSSAPITPESNSSWKVFMILLGLVAAGAAMYFFFLHR